MNLSKEQKVSLIEEALLEYKRDQRDDTSFQMLCDIVLSPHIEPTEYDIEWANKVLEDLGFPINKYIWRYGK